MAEDIRNKIWDKTNDHLTNWEDIEKQLLKFKKADLAHTLRNIWSGR
tara:strand:+ start:734 stop:874 length:141 start_codon:yes stop_codon:yes gene_type:complete